MSMEEEKIVTAKVVLARRPDKATVEKISAFVKSRGCSRIRYIYDGSIIGGIIIYIGDRIYDGSVRSRLDNIRQSV